MFFLGGGGQVVYTAQKVTRTPFPGGEKTYRTLEVVSVKCITLLINFESCPCFTM